MCSPPNLPPIRTLGTASLVCFSGGIECILHDSPGRGPHKLIPGLLWISSSVTFLFDFDLHSFIIMCHVSMIIWGLWVFQLNQI